MMDGRKGGALVLDFGDILSQLRIDGACGSIFFGGAGV